MRPAALTAAVLALAVPGAGAGAPPAANSSVAALQVALRSAGAYTGTIDGIPGSATTRAVVTFQQHRGLEPDGIAGPRTRMALGSLGRPSLGARPLARGMVGWDVAQLQFQLAWQGFPSGRLDGRFGARLEAAVRRFQRHEALPQVGIAGPHTQAALQEPPPTSPLRLSAPIDAPAGDRFGPRDNRFHAGLDFVAGAGTLVKAARSGVVTWAAPRGSFGNTVVVAHGRGVRTLYAHLARVDVAVGERVQDGTRLGLVGSSGRSTGPHLHFEVRVRGAAVDPLTAIG